MNDAFTRILSWIASGGSAMNHAFTRILSYNEANLENLRRQQLNYHKNRSAAWREACKLSRETIEKLSNAGASRSRGVGKAETLEREEKCCNDNMNKLLGADTLCHIYEPGEPGEIRKRIRLLLKRDKTETPLILYHAARALEAADIAYFALTYISLGRHVGIVDTMQERQNIQDTLRACLHIITEHNDYRFGPGAATPQ